MSFKITRRHFVAGTSAFVSLSGSGLLSQAFAQQPAPSAQLIAAAKSEGTVTAYIAMAQEPFVKWVADFTSKYGIRVLAQMQGPNVLAARWGQETRAGRHLADYLLFGGEDVLARANKDGWVAQYKPANDSKFEEGISMRSGKWYGLYTAVEPIVFNTSQMTDAEAKSLLDKNFEALADPVWVGRTSTVVPAASDRCYATYYRLANELGWPFLERLAATKPVFQSTGTAAVNQVAAGQSAVLIAGGTDSLASRAVESGAPVQFVFAKSSTATVQFGAISANAPHPSAARLFAEWAATDEALESLAKITQGLPARPGIADNRPAVSKPWYKPPQVLDVNWSVDEKEMSEKPAFLKRWAEVFNYAE